MQHIAPTKAHLTAARTMLAALETAGRMSVSDRMNRELLKMIRRAVAAAEAAGIKAPTPADPPGRENTVISDLLAALQQVIRLPDATATLARAGHSEQIHHAIEAAINDGIKPTDFATLAQIHRARDEYSSDDIEIDDMNVRTSEADDGTWIAAWVWLADEDEDDAG